MWVFEVTVLSSRFGNLYRVPTMSGKQGKWKCPGKSGNLILVKTTCIRKLPIMLLNNSEKISFTSIYILSVGYIGPILLFLVGIIWCVVLRPPNSDKLATCSLVWSITNVVVDNIDMLWSRRGGGGYLVTTMFVRPSFRHCNDLLMAL